jgi:molecular chaperone DnaK
VKKIVLLDVIPLSLGIETIGDINSVVVPRNTPIPCEKTHTFTTAYTNQKSAGFRVLEGEGFHATDCSLLDKFEVNDIPDAP